MNKGFKFFLLSLSLLFTAQSCKKDDDAIQLKQESKLQEALVSGVNGPTSGKVSQEISFDLMLAAPKIDTRISHMVDSVVGNTRFVKIYQLTNVPDTSALKPVGPMVYKFKPDTAGIYFLKFNSSVNAGKTAITDTIVVR